MIIEELPQGTAVLGVENFLLDQTLDCGQAFRFSFDKESNQWRGVVGGKTLIMEQRDNNVFFNNATKAEVESFWIGYFDLNRDYGKIIEEASSNSILKAASEFARGIRILRQEPWETVCSFIISQNNNIPRIKGIIERLCAGFGDKIDESGYAFPSADKLAGLSAEDLSELRAGFRAKYILDAAQKIADGQIDFSVCANAPLDEARNELMKIKGVGPKVADCSLLFGFGRLNAFPIDTWIKKVMVSFFPDGFPPSLLEYQGIFQQYLFHYARSFPEKLAVS